MLLTGAACPHPRQRHLERPEHGGEYAVDPLRDTIVRRPFEEHRPALQQECKRPAGALQCEMACQTVQLVAGSQQIVAVNLPERGSEEGRRRIEQRGITFHDGTVRVVPGG